MKCSNCGSDIGGEAKFCPSCGAPVVRKQFCSNCGKELAAGMRFCPECGTQASQPGVDVQKELLTDPPLKAQTMPEQPQVASATQNPEDQGGVVALIQSFLSSAYNNTACVLTGDKLTSEAIAKSEAELLDDEQPLLLLKTWSETGSKVSGFLASAMTKVKLGAVSDFMHKLTPGTLLITTKHLKYVRLYKDSFASGFIGGGVANITGKVLLSDVQQISLGEATYGYGPSYVGNQLIINGSIVGLLRISAGPTVDEETFDYLTKLFDFCFNKKGA